MEICSGNIIITHQNLKIAPKVLFHGVYLKNWLKLTQDLWNQIQRNDLSKF